MQKLFFRVKTGYKPNDYLVITEEDLPKVLYAWQNKQIYRGGDRMINGSQIMEISPDYHSYTGWNRGYEPIDYADFAQIKRDCPSEEVFNKAIEKAQVFLLGNKDIKLLDSYKK